jgi:hypothetical protein
MSQADDYSSINETYPLVANFIQIPANVVTDSGRDNIFLKGEIIFLIKKSEEKMILQFKRLNILGSPVNCIDGSSGLLSLNLIRKSEIIEYSTNGKVNIDFEMKLHYPLITKNKVYLRPEAKDPEFFNPYVDSVKGELKGEFGDSLDNMVDVISGQNEPGRISYLNLSINLITKEYPWIIKLEVKDFSVDFLPLISHNWINIQPIFIRDNETDQNPTGWAFDEMMQSAKCIWRKCCVHFNVLDPIYLDNPLYKVLKNRNDVINLKDEVNIDDAVEIFVVNCFDPIKWGGGATFDSGTANSKIVTCDDQLSVISPSGESMGAININHLAHELGHVLGLTHPGSGNPKALMDGTSNTVMNVSGFYADNPSQQSQDNCDNIDNALLYSKKIQNNRKCIQSPEA